MQPVRAEAILRHTHYSFLGSSVAKCPLCLQAHPLIAMDTSFYYTKTVNPASSETEDQTEKGKVKTEPQTVCISVSNGLLKIHFDRNQLSDPQC